jgi:phenylacetate-CoA ligase
MLDYLPGLYLRRFAIKLMEVLRKTEGMSNLQDLEKSQWHSYNQLEELQINNLREHFMWCEKNVPFWQKQFAESGFKPDQLSSIDQLQQLPLMDKSIIREAGDTLFPTDGLDRQRRPKCTSGSTGIPLNYYLDRKSHSFLWGHIWRAWGQTGYKPGDLYATLSGGSLLPEHVDFKQRIYLLLSGCLHLPSYHLTEKIMDEYCLNLARTKVGFMYGYPSSLELFARYVNSKSESIIPAQAVFTTSEMLTTEARSEIEKAFGCPVFDIYGCNDSGLYSFECQHHNGFHQGMESCYVEVVDDDGNCLPDGKIGRIVTTHFANRSHPFIRYITGDVGAIDRSPCECGRGLIRLVNLQGRERDFVRTEDGRKVHGAFFNHFEPFYSNSWIERFQVYQNSVGKLEVRLQVKEKPDQGAVDKLTEELQEGLGKMEIVVIFTDEMELTSSGKFRVVISDVD